MRERRLPLRETKLPVRQNARMHDTAATLPVLLPAVGGDEHRHRVTPRSVTPAANVTTHLLLVFRLLVQARLSSNNRSARCATSERKRAPYAMDAEVRAQYVDDALRVARYDLIAHRLPLFAACWVGTTAVWSIVLMTEARSTPSARR